MTARRPRTRITLADTARGAAAKDVFQDWLDASQVAHVYLDQTPITVPEALRGRIKSPDYLVGIPGVGLVAFDVKSKTIYPKGIIFDLVEIQKLRTFARLFHLTVYFACLSGDELQAYWVRLDQLDDVPAIRRNGTLTLCLPAEHGLPISHAQPFYAAFVAAMQL